MYNTIAYHLKLAADTTQPGWSLSYAPASPLPLVRTGHDVSVVSNIHWLVWSSYPSSDPFQVLVKINPILAKPRTQCNDYY